MRAYIIRRLLLIIPTLFIVTVIVFFSVRFIPGNVIDLMVAEMQDEATMGGQKITRDYITKQLGLDVPVHVQYGRWLSGVVRGDLGTSLWMRRPITEELFNHIPVSLELGIIAIISALLIAFPIGTYSAIRQDTAGDYGGRTFSILCISMPSFWIGTMVVVYPSVYLGWAPQFEYIPIVQDLPGNLFQFVLPGFILGMVLSGTTMRITRTMMLEVLRQDYIRTAWAKGLRERTVIFRHALKNAMIPVVTDVGNHAAVIVIGGSIILEQIFTLPGMGRWLVEALYKRDYPIVSAINLAIGSFTLFLNLAIDLTYAWLDPRVHYK